MRSCTIVMHLCRIFGGPTRRGLFIFLLAGKKRYILIHLHCLFTAPEWRPVAASARGVAWDEHDEARRPRRALHFRHVRSRRRR